MPLLQFTATNQQRAAIEGLAYWIADHAYIAERYGRDDPEIARVDATIRALFDSLDALCVPYWVQNSVIVFAENWRAYKSHYLSVEMSKKNIIL